MAHHARKTSGEVDLFAKIRDKMGNAAKAEGQSQAPNLVGPVVDVYRPPTAKRPAPSKMKEAACFCKNWRCGVEWFEQSRFGWV